MNWIAFGGKAIGPGGFEVTDIWAVNVNTCVFAQLTDIYPEDPPLNTTDARSPTWSPILAEDDTTYYTQIAYSIGHCHETYGASMWEDCWGGDRDLMVMNVFIDKATGDLTTGTPVQLTATPAKHETTPDWDSAGDYLVFTRDGGDPQERGVFRIRADGTGEELITDQGACPRWSPDMAYLSLWMTEGIYRIRSDGSDMTWLTNGSYVKAADWSPVWVNDLQEPCTMDGECDDGNACTTDTCNAGTCGNAPVDCSDGDACTIDCDPALGCLDPPRPSINCNDGDPCTLDSCDPDTGCVNQAKCEDDGDACTTDCDPATGDCLYAPIPGCGTCGVNGDPCSDPADCCSGNCKKGVCRGN